MKGATTIDPALSTTLTAVGEAMAKAQDPWWIIGSAAVALHGADPGLVADVDVLLGIADARRVLPTLGLVPRSGALHADFRSDVFATWTTPWLPVEFMAGFRHRSAGAWRPVLPLTREAVRHNGIPVFIPSRAELGNILRGFGRAKDIVRAERLAGLPS